MIQEITELLVIWVVFIVILSIMAVKPMVSCLTRGIKYGGIPSSSENREKMKFVTQLSKAEVIEGLRSHKANDIFEYEFRSESDIVYILLIKGIDFFKGYCKENVTYKVVITSETENTVVWVVLYEGDNENAIERYGWELKGFMEKKIMAVRVE